MNQKPKIFVFKLRELIYTLVLLFLAILLIVCLVLMFTGKSKGTNALTQSQSERAAIDASENAAANTSGTVFTDAADAAVTDASEITTAGASGYVSGIYTSTVTLGDSAADIEVTVDDDHINAIRLVNLNEAAAASYPLVTPSFDHIAEQILASQSLEGITCPQENKYTSQILLSAIAEALEKAQK